MSSPEVSDVMNFEATPLSEGGSLTAEQVRAKLTMAATGHALSSSHEVVKPREFSPEERIALWSGWIIALRNEAATDTPTAWVDERRLAQDLSDLAA